MEILKAKKKQVSSKLRGGEKDEVGLWENNLCTKYIPGKKVLKSSFLKTLFYEFHNFAFKTNFPASFLLY